MGELIDVRVGKAPKGSAGGYAGGGTIYAGNPELAQRAKIADFAKNAAEATHAREADHAVKADGADTAGRADVADKLSDKALEELGNNRFLRKDRGDRTPFPLAVGGKLTAETEIGSKDFADGLTGTGWLIDAEGAIQAKSLMLREFLEVHTPIRY